MKEDLQGLFSTLRDQDDPISDLSSEGSSSSDDLPSLPDAAPSRGEKTPAAVVVSSMVPPALPARKEKRKREEDDEDPSESARKKLRFHYTGSTGAKQQSKTPKMVSPQLIGILITW